MPGGYRPAGKVGHAVHRRHADNRSWNLSPKSEKWKGLEHVAFIVESPIEFNDVVKLYLASRSPRRRELLASLKIPFEVIAPRFEEIPTELSASEEALFLAERKARSVSDLCPDSLVIGSDTLIDCEGEKLGKPRDREDAEKILRKLSGKRHRVLTAVALLDTKAGTVKKHVGIAEVSFRVLSDQEIRDYVATGEPMGKAGAYAVQEKGRGLIAEIQGELDLVIGLPLKIIREWIMGG